MHIDDPSAEQLLSRPLKLAFFDIDGTLLGLDGDYSARLARAISALQKAGVKTAVASGRPKFAADFLIDELGLEAAGLYCTGAHIENPLDEEGVIALHSLSAALVSQLLVAATELGLYTELCFRDHFYVEKWPHVGQLHSRHLRSVPTQVESLLALAETAPVLKLLFAVTTIEEHELLYRLEKQFPETVFAYAKMAAKPDWLFVSVISESGCKRTGFQQLLDFHGVQACETIAFGDAQSDKIFLELAGVGVALGNAAEDVKQVADIETVPVWDDGVAVVLEKYLELTAANALES